MSPGDGNAGRGANRSAAFQNFADGLHRQFAQRHSQDRERHDRLAAHGIDIRERVGGGDPAEIAGVVHNRHEEVGGGDHACLVVDLPDSRVVARLGADEKLRIGHRGRLIGEKLLQHRRRQLAAAAAAVRETGQSDLGGAHYFLRCGPHPTPINAPISRKIIAGEGWRNPVQIA